MTTIRDPLISIAVSLSDVVSQPDAGEIEFLVLANVAPAGSKTTTIAERLGEPAETIHAAVLRLAQGGLVEATGDSVTLTQTGRLAAASVRKSWPDHGGRGQSGVHDRPERGRSAHRIIVAGGC